MQMSTVNSVLPAYHILSAGNMVLIRQNQGPLKTPGRKTKMTELNFEKGGGLLPVIVQDYTSREVLMLAYINEEAWEHTIASGKAHFWSRSRKKLWLKGESSKHYQIIKEILLDCDEDTVIYLVEQQGGAACHKGYRSCFFRRLRAADFEIKDEPVFDPAEVYKK